MGRTSNHEITFSQTLAVDVEDRLLGLGNKIALHLYTGGEPLTPKFKIYRASKSATLSTDVKTFTS